MLTIDEESKLGKFTPVDDTAQSSGFLTGGGAIAVPVAKNITDAVTIIPAIVLIATPPVV
jgi:hypothetical protein